MLLYITKKLLVSSILFFSIASTYAQENTNVELIAFSKGKGTVISGVQKVSAKQLPDSLVLKAIAPTNSKYVVKYRMIFGPGAEPAIDNNPNEFDMAENKAVLASDMLQALGKPNQHLAFDVWTVYKIDGTGKIQDTKFSRTLYKISFTE
jgi:hypothetical protein